MGEQKNADEDMSKEERRRLKAEKKARKEAKKAKKEEKRKRKREEGEDVKDEEEAPADVSGDESSKERKSKKKDKKISSSRLSKEEKKTLRAEKKAAKKAEKATLLEQVPKTDEHGIAYTKIQIRRMTRRVKRGLPPVPTDEEERERARQDKIDRELEEREWADMLHTPKDYSDNEEDDDSDSDGGDDGGDDEDNEELVQDDAEEQDEESKPTSQQPRAKKSKRSKPVPPDYVCQACKNKHQPVHWIYDCPDKVTVRGTNQVAKKLRGINQPDSRKVFVSGLPFEIKTREVEKYFEESCGKVVHCKLLTFEETKRCKGQAFVTFETDEAAKKAIRASGGVFDYEPEKSQQGKKKRKKGQDEEKKKEKKELVLKVTKVKNRVATGGRKW